MSVEHDTVGDGPATKNHPDIAALIELIANTESLAIGEPDEGSEPGSSYVIVAAMDREIMFTFTRAEDGSYVMTCNR
ncbi:hypothetical protein FOZ76_20630 [Verticiella sediminum]|uniref:Uncharacterized protein n=1 Tax=Verticiella sediminum TaxID=1247510 RepID=A0A556ABH6_9BURK|nr:hypothetical protein [Verticiella sediminum]TSH90244.1 hypothetical protein FOZ76_20630 [Verticiella sediminum]